MTAPFVFRQGESPLIVSFPHQGTAIPDDVAKTMSPTGLASIDTDWFVREMYDCLEELDATIICAHWSRYVVDLNRAPDNRTLYPGRSNTAIIPELSFANVPLYQEQVPSVEEIGERVETYWRPYHVMLERCIARNQQHHGYALLWDAHSIRGQVPQLFDGRLPELNFGTNDNASASQAIGLALLNYASSQSPYSAVLNGRFKGGYITRHYGAPEQQVHAVQLEMNQQIYLEDELQQPPKVAIEKASRLRIHLRRLLQLYLVLGKQNYQSTTSGTGVSTQT